MILSRFNPPDREIGTDVAIVSVGWSTVSIVIYLALGLIFFTTNYIAQIFGDGQYDQVGVVFWTTNYVTLICWGMCAAFIPAMKPLLMLLDDKSNPTTGLLLRAEIEYSKFVLTWAISFLLYEHGASVFAGISRPIPIIVVNILSLIVNAGADYVFIIVLKKGYMGAAYGTVTAKGFGALLFFSWLLFSGKFRKQYKLLSLRSLIPDVKLLLKMCVLGFCSGLVRALELVVWTVYLFLMQFVGAMEVTATGLATTVHEVMGMIVYGMAGAQEILVALHLGAKQPGAAVRVTKVAVFFLTVYLLFVAGLYNGIPRFILRMFVEPEDFTSPDELSKLLESGEIVLRLFAAFAYGEMLCLSLSSTLQASGDTITPTVCSLLALVGCVVVPGILLAKQGKMTVMIGTILMVAYSFACSLPVLVVVLIGRWKKTDLIESTHEKAEEGKLSTEEGEEVNKEIEKESAEAKEEEKKKRRERRKARKAKLEERKNETPEEKEARIALKNQRKKEREEQRKRKEEQKSRKQQEAKKDKDEKGEVDEETLGLLSNEESNVYDESSQSSDDLSTISSSSLSFDSSETSDSNEEASQNKDATTQSGASSVKSNEVEHTYNESAPLLKFKESDTLNEDDQFVPPHLVKSKSTQNSSSTGIGSGSGEALNQSVVATVFQSKDVDASDGLSHSPTDNSNDGNTLISEAMNQADSQANAVQGDTSSQIDEKQAENNATPRSPRLSVFSVATLPTQYRLRADSSKPNSSSSSASTASSLSGYSSETVSTFRTKHPSSRVPVTSSYLSSSVIPIRPPDMPKAPITLKKKKKQKKSDATTGTTNVTSDTHSGASANGDAKARTDSDQCSLVIPSSSHNNQKQKHKSSRHAYHQQRDKKSSTQSSSVGSNQQSASGFLSKHLNLVIPPFRGLRRSLSFRSKASSFASLQRILQPFPFAPTSSSSGGRTVGSGASAAAVGMSLAENVLKEMKKEMEDAKKFEAEKGENVKGKAKMNNKKNFVNAEQSSFLPETNEQLQQNSAGTSMANNFFYANSNERTPLVQTSQSSGYSSTSSTSPLISMNMSSSPNVFIINNGYSYVGFQTQDALLSKGQEKNREKQMISVPQLIPPPEDISKISELNESSSSVVQLNNDNLIDAPSNKQMISDLQNEDQKANIVQHYDLRSMQTKEDVLMIVKVEQQDSTVVEKKNEKGKDDSEISNKEQTSIKDASNGVLSHPQRFERSPLASPSYSLNADSDEEDARDATESVPFTSSLQSNQIITSKFDSSLNGDVSISESTSDGRDLAGATSQDLQNEASSCGRIPLDEERSFTALSKRSSMLHIGDNSNYEGVAIKDNQLIIGISNDDSNDNRNFRDSELKLAVEGDEDGVHDSEWNQQLTGTEDFYAAVVDVEAEEREIKRKEEELEDQRELLRQLEEEEFRKGFSDDNEDSEDEGESGNAGNKPCLQIAESLKTEKETKDDMVHLSSAEDATVANSDTTEKTKQNKAADDEPFLPFESALKLYQTTSDSPPSSPSYIAPSLFAAALHSAENDENESVDSSEGEPFVQDDLDTNSVEKANESKQLTLDSPKGNEEPPVSSGQNE
ncbi:putative MATE family efflux transporter [Monocercomonoides exilis]|uniref:putative MATE family efflux transporter n=1 Tax=Monocercomonoides exilis TaxID=2049356 RepID=UPI003559D6A1|nr:putative MATE family efflux transporter [Monocercomonoides exilis]|eukprot:MONOS_12276.1-p1 / transcript=MONOS_12276.1 / gene=MONOS_12276 / organism=Monocercomonoides_exilis_PA203 / gene_product=Multi Antimicrobial Extrusion (MATE) Family Protein / transcript_product=Multi Antimicrobial Extrusion (MATE) Family Protein / location=Mono_scaffold00669:22219-26967(-) / protein_length=1583 / sequence_SO=supercontig / SO=protein_coding / is_pseudo=false